MALLVAGAVPTASAAAQSAVPALEPGSRVRAETDGGRVQGTLERFSGDSLRIRGSDGSISSVARHRVLQLRVANGKKRLVVEGLIVGAMVGGVAGVQIGCSIGNIDCKKSYAALDGFGIGILSGLVLGGIVGNSTQVDRWTTIPVGANALALDLLSEPVRSVTLSWRVPLGRARLTTP